VRLLPRSFAASPVTESPVAAAPRREAPQVLAERDILPVPLNPVDSLSPVETLGIRRSAQ
jgi:hypothetical protein